MVRVDRIELTQPAWKAGVLPLNYTRDRIEWLNIELILIRSSPFRDQFAIRMKLEWRDRRVRGPIGSPDSSVCPPAVGIEFNPTY